MNQPSNKNELLYPQGYLITPEGADVSVPGIEHWMCRVVKGRRVYTHANTEVHVYEADCGDAWILIGHAYDPWHGMPDEMPLLEQLDVCHRKGKESFFSALDSLSGRFVLFHLESDRSGMAVQDAVGLKNLFFTDTPQGNCFASHSQLLADALKLQRDPNVDELIKSFFYQIGIRHLPGLQTPFQNMRMLSANTLLRFPKLEVERFFPRTPHIESNDLPKTAKIIGDVFKASFELLSQKKTLALSLSTGTDSRVSLAASRNNQESIHYFSYISDAAEEKDAIGAHELCRLLGIKHTIYRVPVDNFEELEDAHIARTLDHNAAYIRNPKLPERAKLHYLLTRFPKGMMEVKTPVSEIGRAFYCKKMELDALPQSLTPRHMSNLYKPNMLNRKLLRFMDGAFRDYINTTDFGVNFYNYEQHDMFYWEHRNSAWCSLANQDHDILHDMTVIFNNRDVLKLLLSPSRPDRIKDRLHLEIIQYLWPETLQVPISNMESPRKRLRKLAQRIFFKLNLL